MNGKLTAKQFKTLVGIHNSANSGRIRTRNRTRIVTDAKEVERLSGSIISHYAIDVKRSHSKGDDVQTDD